MDVNTRRLRYFVAVAEELHFGRAAAQFYIAQQAMSRQIRELESELSVQLFDRDTRSVALTADGMRFLTYVRSALAAFDEGVRVAQVGDPTSTPLRIGFRFGAALELTGPILAAVASQRPGLHLELRELNYRSLDRTYDDDDVDVSIIRQTVDAMPGGFQPLFAEPRVAAFARTNELATRDEVSVDDLRDQTIVVGDRDDPQWVSYWTLEPELGQPPRSLVRAGSQIEELEIVAAGQACSVIGASAARFMPHPGIVYIPISGIDPCVVGISWDPDNTDPRVGEFVSIAKTICASLPDLVSFISDPFGTALDGDRPRLD